MDRQLPTDEARQEREQLRSGLSKSARALIALAEKESGLADVAEANDIIPPMPVAIKEAFNKKFPQQEPDGLAVVESDLSASVGSTSQSWWRRSGPAFLSGMAAAAVIMTGLFLAGPFQPTDTSWSEFRGHGLPPAVTDRSIVYTFFEGSESLKQTIGESWLQGQDVREAASEEALYAIIENQFDSVHIVIDETNQTIRGLVPSVTTRQVQDSFASEADNSPIDSAAVYELIDEVKRACLVLVMLEEKVD